MNPDSTFESNWFSISRGYNSSPPKVSERAQSHPTHPWKLIQPVSFIWRKQEPR